MKNKINILIIFAIFNFLFLFDVAFAGECKYDYHFSIDAENGDKFITTDEDLKDDEISAEYSEKKFALKGSIGGKEDLMNWSEDKKLPKIGTSECPKYLYHIDKAYSLASSEYYGTNENYHKMAILYFFAGYTSDGIADEITVFKLKDYEEKREENGGGLLASCRYDYENLNERIYIFVDIEYNITALSTNEYVSFSNFPQELVYDNFIKDDKLDCSNFSETVYRILHENGGMTPSNDLSLVENNNYTSFKHSLNKEESFIFSKTPDIEAQKGNVEKTCHYKNYVFYLYKDGTYSTNIKETDDTNIYLDKSYSVSYRSCPLYLCIDQGGYQGVYWHDFKFSDQEVSMADECYVVTIHDDDKFTCGVVGNFDILIRESYNNYASSGDANDYLIYKNHKENLKTFCSAAFESMNYNAPNKCVIECLNEIDEINKLEQTSTPEGACNLSHKLIVFIRNILRWIKYIIPAAVIVLGILDFIKAIGADKDDEIKKAQGRFIKRLIAAALIFLIPLIIEFILGQMGFGYNDCGLF